MEHHVRRLQLCLRDRRADDCRFRLRLDKLLLRLDLREPLLLRPRDDGLRLKEDRRREEFRDREPRLESRLPPLRETVRDRDLSREFDLLREDRTLLEDLERLLLAANRRVTRLVPNRRPPLNRPAALATEALDVFVYPSDVPPSAVNEPMSSSDAGKASSVMARSPSAGRESPVASLPPSEAESGAGASSIAASSAGGSDPSSRAASSAGASSPVGCKG